MKGRLLDICMWAYPRDRRVRDGAALHDLVRELSEHHGAFREAIGLLRGGFAARVEDAASGARAPWGAALRLLALPLAAVNAAIWVTGAVRLDTLDLGLFWMLLLAGSLLALAGAAARSRTPMLVGALIVLGTLMADSIRTGPGEGVRRSAFDASLDNFSVDVFAALLPAAALLVAAAFAVPARGDWRARALAPKIGLGGLPTVVLLLLGTGLLVPLLAVLPPLAALVGALRARRDPALTLAGALLLAAWAPEAVWLASGHLPIDSPTLGLGLAVWLVGGAVIGAILFVLLALARRPVHV